VHRRLIACLVVITIALGAASRLFPVGHPVWDKSAGDAAYATMPSDKLVTLDRADALMVPGTQAEQQAFAALPGYGQLQLVQESKVVTLDDEQSAALAFGSVLSLPAVIDEVAGRLSRAVER